MDGVASLPYAIIGYVVMIGQILQCRLRSRRSNCPSASASSGSLESSTRLPGPVERDWLQMIGFIMVAHWVACVWWLIGEAQYAQPRPVLHDGRRRHSRRSWLMRVPLGSTPIDVNTAITPFEQQYMSSLYWSLTTLMKTPWVGPDTVTEKVYASAMVILGAMCFAVLLGNVTAMINSLNKRHSERVTTSRRCRPLPTSDACPPAAAQDVRVRRRVLEHDGGLDHSAILASLPRPGHRPRLHTQRAPLRMCAPSSSELDTSQAAYAKSRGASSVWWHVRRRVLGYASAMAWRGSRRRVRAVQSL